MPDKQGQWKKGQSGNAKGRPAKYASLTSLLKIEIEKVAPRDREKRTWKELIVLATMKLALKGHPQALREIWERLDGKPVQPIAGPNDGPIKILVEYASECPPSHIKSG